MGAVGGGSSSTSQFQRNFVTDIVGNLDDMASSLPCVMQLSAVAKTELVTHCQLDFTQFELWEIEPSNVLLIQTYIPANDNIITSLFRVNVSQCMFPFLSLSLDTCLRLL